MKNAADLQRAFPGMRGFSVQNLWRMKQFYVTHTAEEFLAQVVREIDHPEENQILRQPVAELRKMLCFRQVGTPDGTRGLLAEFWKLEKEAEKMLEGLAK